MRIDTDKLKVLADNIKDYIYCYGTKLIKTANANGHTMKAFIAVQGMKGHGGDYTEEYNSYCSRCTFSLWIEHIHTDGEDKVYLTGDDMDNKCVLFQAQKQSRKGI